MATKVRRVSEFAKHGMNYLLRRDESLVINKERDREKSWLKTHIENNGVKDEAGNLNVYFDRPVPGPGTTIYYGLQQRRSPGAEYMNTDEVKRFVAKLDPELQEQVVYIKPVEVVDTEALYVLYQEGHITKQQLRSLIRHEPDKYQLWPIEEPPMEDDDE